MNVMCLHTHLFYEISFSKWSKTHSSIIISHYKRVILLIMHRFAPLSPTNIDAQIYRKINKTGVYILPATIVFVFLFLKFIYLFSKRFH